MNASSKGEWDNDGQVTRREFRLDSRQAALEDEIMEDWEAKLKNGAEDQK